MACAELVLPGNFDEGHHGGSGLGSDCAHTVSLYRQKLEVVQGWSSVLLSGAIGRCGRRVRCRGEAWLKVLPVRKTHRQECLCHLDGCQAFLMEVLCYRGRGPSVLRGVKAHDEESVVVATGPNGVGLQS
jgi:hypothetical protein